MEIEGTEFDTGNTVMITGIAKSTSARLTIDITDEDGINVVKLETPITSDNAFSTPWTIPHTVESGTYTITVSDTENTESIQIFIR